MINLWELQPHIPQVRLENYTYILAGERKVGKTDLFIKFLKKYGGDINYGLLLAFEPGYKNQHCYSVDVNKWKDFEDVVKQLEAAKTSGKELPFKFIGIDTIDRLWDYAVKETIRIYNIHNANKGKVAREIGDIPYGNGYTMAQNLIRETVDRIIKAGYGIIAITHTKKVYDDSDKVKEITTSMPEKCKDVFEKWFDAVIFFVHDLNEEGEPIRKLVFQNDGLYKAGGRFAKIKQSIEYDGDVSKFIETLEEGIRLSLEANMDGEHDIDELKKKQAEEKEQKVKEYVSQQAEQEKLVDQIAAMGKAMKPSQRKQFVSRLASELGSSDFKQLSVDELKQAIEIAQEIIGE